MDDRSSSRRPQRQGSAPRSQRQQPPVRSQRGGRGMHMDMDVLNGRLAIFFVAFCVFALILAIRLFGLMVIDAQANLNRDSSREVTVDVQPRRGTIYDRNGIVLATSVEATTIYANPVEVTDAAAEAASLASVLGGDAADYRELLSTPSTTFVYIKRQADVDVADKVKELKLDGVYFIADTTINSHPDEDALFDIARLARNSVEYFAHEPVMALISYSNFGASKLHGSRIVHNVAARMQEMYPELPVDGEMQIDFALNNKVRDINYPFNRLNGKDVNTLIFPNLSSANTAWKMLLSMGVGEVIGPIQMGLNKPIHFISVDAAVRDIVNLTTIAVIDAAVVEKVGNDHDK